MQQSIRLANFFSQVIKKFHLPLEVYDITAAEQNNQSQNSQGQNSQCHKIQYAKSTNTKAAEVTL